MTIIIFYYEGIHLNIVYNTWDWQEFCSVIYNLKSFTLIDNLFSKSLQKLVKVLQKQNVVLSLWTLFLNSLSFLLGQNQKRIKQKSDKNWVKTKCNWAWFTSGPIEGAMALPVMEFQEQGYKIRKIFA